jgi:anti-sigma B factor antagonist
MNTNSGILAIQTSEAVWLRLFQKGCFQNSHSMEKYIDSHCRCGKRRFVVDLDGCGGLDSTFMGMLLGTAKKLKKLSGDLQIINAAGRNGQLLKGLGVHYFCPVREDAGDLTTPANFKDTAEEIPLECLSKPEQTTHCLKAHVELAESCESNKQRFCDVISLMEKQCGGQK